MSDSTPRPSNVSFVLRMNHEFKPDLVTRSVGSIVRCQNSNEVTASACNWQQPAYFTPSKFRLIFQGETACLFSTHSPSPT